MFAKNKINVNFWNNYLIRPFQIYQTLILTKSASTMSYKNCIFFEKFLRALWNVNLVLWNSERSAPCQLWWSKHWLNSSMKVLLAQLSLSYIKANKINKPCQMVFMNLSNFQKKVSMFLYQIIGLHWSK